MPAKITKRQKELLSIVYNYIKNTGYPPTIEEMKDSLRVISNQSVIDLLRHLEMKKYIKRQDGIARSIVILPSGYQILNKPSLVPFLGLSHAGAPIDSIQIDGQWEELPSQFGKLEKLQSEVFIVKVNGDSMINAGIEDGDKVLIQVKKEFSSGDIVLADLNGESTIKRFISDDKPPYVYLKPENPNYKIILFTHQMRLIGKVVYIFKQDRTERTN